VNRKDLQNVAETRLKDAHLLYQHRRFDAAYYLACYVIECAECALKACIAKKTKRHDFPDKTFAHNVYIHDLTKLLKHTGL
jgi:HEPN domain-containing protein